VDGAKGIARRIAYLARDQTWPDAPTPGIAVFTAPIEMSSGLQASLARMGLTEIKQL
jgi:glutamate racemase